MTKMYLIESLEGFMNKEIASQDAIILLQNRLRFRLIKGEKT